MTFCEPNPIEIDDLKSTVNFGGQTGWFSGEAKNLPPNQSSSSQQNVGHEMTPLNSFESDVLEFTPMDSSAPDWQI